MVRLRDAALAMHEFGDPRAPDVVLVRPHRLADQEVHAVRAHEALFDESTPDGEGICAHMREWLEAHGAVGASPLGGASTAVLIRPDGHVAMIAYDDGVREPPARDALDRALDAVYGR